MESILHTFDFRGQCGNDDADKDSAHLVHWKLTCETKHNKCEPKAVTHIWAARICSPAYATYATTHAKNLLFFFYFSFFRSPLIRIHFACARRKSFILILSARCACMRLAYIACSRPKFSHPFTYTATMMSTFRWVCSRFRHSITNYNFTSVKNFGISAKSRQPKMCDETSSSSAVEIRLHHLSYRADGLFRRCG